MNDGGRRSSTSGSWQKIMDSSASSFPYSKVVITGGCGYVGRQLANALQEAYPGIEIVLFDVIGKLSYHEFIALDLFPRLHCHSTKVLFMLLQSFRWDLQMLCYHVNLDRLKFLVEVKLKLSPEFR